MIVAHRRRTSRRPLVELRRTAGVDEATRRPLQSVIVPIWVGAGLADWACHRRTHIETTAGTQESVIHALMMTEAGIPSVLGLFFEVDAGVLATTLAAFAVHETTAMWDVAYADGRRQVTPTEQHVHGLLEQVPTMATAFLFALHWDQARALFAVGGRRPVLSLQRRRRPLSRGYRWGLLATLVRVVGVPYAEELWRCASAQRAMQYASHDERAEATT